VDSATDERNGRTGRQACCACGGGMPTSHVNLLLSWKLFVYGHGDGGSEIKHEVAMDPGSSTGGSAGASRSHWENATWWFVLLFWSVTPWIF
jgi:hypothetical protein